jgi:hypothetical protein
VAGDQLNTFANRHNDVISYVRRRLQDDRRPQIVRDLLSESLAVTVATIDGVDDELILDIGDTENGDWAEISIFSVSVPAEIFDEVCILWSLAKSVIKVFLFPSVLLVKPSSFAAIIRRMNSRNLQFAEFFPIRSRFAHPYWLERAYLTEIFTKSIKDVS